MKKYSVHSIFWTLQGEGPNAGAPALFVRFAGCNVWNGEEATRAEAAEKGACAAVCDTEFSHRRLGPGGGLYTARDLAMRMVELLPEACTAPLPALRVVFTGGEPLLQLDKHLVDLVRVAFPSRASRIAVEVETNGSIDVSDDLLSLVELNVSPKPPMPLVHRLLQHAACVKVLYPLYADFLDEIAERTPAGVPLYLCPVDPTFGTPPTELEKEHKVRVSRFLERGIVERATAYAMANPRWHVGVQLHKALGIP